MKRYDWVVFKLLSLCDWGFDRETCVGTHKGRKVRLNCHGHVDIGDGYFDRWAAS